jgi:hypothetical protein
MKHEPTLYVGGVYLSELDEWRGEFYASQRELLDYAEHDVSTVAEFDIVMTMAIAQYEYEAWWRKIRNEKRTK